MEKGTITNFGFVIITIIIVSILLAGYKIASTKAGESVNNVAETIIDKVDAGEDNSSYAATDICKVTIYYKFTDNAKQKDPYTIYVKRGENCYMNFNNIEGYTPSTASLNTVVNNDVEYTITYNPN